MNSLASLPIGSPAGVETMLPNRIADKRGQIDVFYGVSAHMPNIKKIYHLHGGQASRGGRTSKYEADFILRHWFHRILLSDGSVKPNLYPLSNFARPDLRSFNLG